MLKYFYTFLQEWGIDLKISHSGSSSWFGIPFIVVSTAPQVELNCDKCDD